MNQLRAFWRRALRLVGLSPGQRRTRSTLRLLSGLTRAQVCRVTGVSVYADEAELQRGRERWLVNLRLCGDIFDLTGARTDEEALVIVEGWKRGATRAAELKQELGIK